MDTAYNKKDGGAEFADFAELRRSGFVGLNKGVCIGVDETCRYNLHAEIDHSALAFCGSRGGKSASLYTNLLLDEVTASGAVYDGRGELWDTCVLGLSVNSYNCYRFAPLRGDWHGCNPWAGMYRNDPALYLKNISVFRDMIPSDDPRDWPAENARGWGEAINVCLTDNVGRTSPPDFYKILCAIDGDPELWGNFLKLMNSSRYPDVKRVAGAMMRLQELGRDSWTAPLGKLHNAFAFLKDERISAALDGDDFTIEGLIDPSTKDMAFFELPVNHPSVTTPLSRLLIGGLITAKIDQDIKEKFVLYLDDM